MHHRDPTPGRGATNPGGHALRSLSEQSLDVVQGLRENGIVVDFRDPDIVRITPAPLYNNYSDIYQLVWAIHEAT